MASTFPDKIDEIKPFLDITQQDGELIKQFETYIQNEDFYNARLILQKIENVDNKIISATRMNQLRECILALERFYNDTEYQNYIQQQHNSWEDKINQFTYKGLYSSNKLYNINNIVSFNYQGEDNLFLRINGDGISGKVPTDTKFWRKLTVKGERGITLNNETVFYFDWASNQNYNVNSIVAHNGDWWIALNSNINSEPSEGNVNWQLIMNAMQVVYPVSESQPISQDNGELWFEVIA